MPIIPLLCLGAVPAHCLEALEARGFQPLTLDQLDENEGSSLQDIRAAVRQGGTVIEKALFDRLPNLEMIANFGVGYDAANSAIATERGVVIANTPGVLDAEVADFTVGLLLSVLRRIPQADRFLRDESWMQASFPLSPTLRGRTVGIVGMGRIGQAIARRISAFEVPVVYHSRRPNDDLAWPHFPDLHVMAEHVDTLIVIVPGGAETKHLIDATVLRKLGTSGVVINVSRGSVMDETALVGALARGEILAAGLDVFDTEPTPAAELREMQNVVLTPHIGSGTHHTRQAMWDLVFDNLCSWFHDGELISPVPESLPLLAARHSERQIHG
jgi:lactate dehydrogenase-like 2-hydroxyacid dehydrogenase